MEAAVLFTLGALRKIAGRLPLTVSDIEVEGEFVRISDEEMRGAVDEMTELALATITAEEALSVPRRGRFPRQPGVRERVDRTTVARDRRLAPRAGLDRRDALLRATGTDRGTRRGARPRGRGLVVAVGGDGTVNETVERPHAAR